MVPSVTILGQKEMYFYVKLGTLNVGAPPSPKTIAGEGEKTVLPQSPPVAYTIEMFDHAVK